MIFLDSKVWKRKERWSENSNTQGHNLIILMCNIHKILPLMEWSPEYGKYKNEAFLSKCVAYFISNCAIDSVEWYLLKYDPEETTGCRSCCVKPNEERMLKMNQHSTAYFIGLRKIPLFLSVYVLCSIQYTAENNPWKFL